MCRYVKHALALFARLCWNYSTAHAARGAVQKDWHTEVLTMRPRVSSWLVLGICLAAFAAVIVFELI